MTDNNYDGQNAANPASNATERGDPNTAENAVSHGGKFGTDDTVSHNNFAASAEDPENELV